MNEKFLTPDFKYERYISERLLEIPDEEKRRALKEIIQKTMIPFYEHTRECYEELEKRLTEGKGIEGQAFEIITGIEHRTKIDITEEAMVPMNYDDLNEFTVDVEQMLDDLELGKAYTIMRIFVKGDYPFIRKLEHENRQFNSTIVTEHGEYHGRVKLVKNRSYIQKIEELYDIFENNGIPWNTVCMPYLNKFFDVCIVNTDCPAEEQILRMKIDFEEYASYISYDMVPMWNIRMKEERTGAYPDLALDRIHYEHCIFRSRLAQNRDYMIAEPDLHLWNVFMQEGDLHIVCDQEKDRKWKLLEFGYDSKNKSYEYPVYSNGAGENYSKRMIHTMAELKKYVNSLKCKDLTLVDVVMCDSYDAKADNTYSCDDFLCDEIRNVNSREVLKFTFRAADPVNYLNYDIMSYLLSRVQWLLPEFKCVGEIE